MAINITKSDQPLPPQPLTVVLYGQPGVGKTSLAYTASNPLLLDFERGSHRAIGRGDSVQIEKWSDLADLRQSDLRPYSTIIVDTGGRCLDVITADLIEHDKRMSARSGQLTLQGYGALKARFVQWVNQLRSSGKDLVIVAHAEEQRVDGDVQLRVDMVGGSKGEIVKLADVLGYVCIRRGLRVIDFAPGDIQIGKDPADLGEVEIPNLNDEPDFLARTLAMHRDAFVDGEQAARRAPAEAEPAAPTLREKRLKVFDKVAYDASWKPDDIARGAVLELLGVLPDDLFPTQKSIRAFVDDYAVRGWMPCRMALAGMVRGLEDAGE